MPALHLLDDLPCASIHDGQRTKRTSSKLDSNYIICGSILLLDAKYKNPAANSQADDRLEMSRSRRIRVPRINIYQMVAYRQHNKWRNPAGALTYTIFLMANETLPVPYQVRGFGAPVYICFIDIGPHARNNLSRFLDYTQRMASREAPREI